MYQALFFPLSSQRSKNLRLRVNVKVQRGPTFTFTRDLPYIVSDFIYARTHEKNYATVHSRPQSPSFLGHVILSVTN